MLPIFLRFSGAQRFQNLSGEIMNDDILRFPSHHIESGAPKIYTYCLSVPTQKSHGMIFKN